MSKIICSGCGAWIEDTDRVCSVCGAQNINIKKAHDRRPKTILELKRWYDLNNATSRQKHCVFGSRSTQPGVVGIFKENNQYYVYKNDLNGRNTVMYNGDDEEYAVDFIYSELTRKIAGRQETDKYLLERFIETSNTNVKTMYKLIAAIAVEWILIIWLFSSYASSFHIVYY